MTAQIHRLSPWMTVAECAQYMRRSRSYVYKGALAGRIPSHGSGQDRRFHVDEIDQYMRGLNAKSEQAPSLSTFQEVRLKVLRSLKTEVHDASPDSFRKKGAG